MRPPNAADRTAILELLAQTTPVSEDVSLAQLAALTDGFSGAALRGLFRCVHWGSCAYDLCLSLLAVCGCPGPSRGITSETPGLTILVVCLPPQGRSHARHAPRGIIHGRRAPASVELGVHRRPATAIFTIMIVRAHGSTGGLKRGKLPLCITRISVIGFKSSVQSLASEMLHYVHYPIATMRTSHLPRLGRPAQAPDPHSIRRVTPLKHARTYARGKERTPPLSFGPHFIPRAANRGRRASG